MVTIWPEARPIAIRTVGNLSIAKAAEETSASASFWANSLAVHDGCTAEPLARWRTAAVSHNLMVQDPAWPGDSKPTVSSVTRESCRHTAVIVGLCLPHRLCLCLCDKQITSARRICLTGPAWAWKVVSCFRVLSTTVTCTYKELGCLAAMLAPI